MKDLNQRIGLLLEGESDKLAYRRLLLAMIQRAALDLCGRFPDRHESTGNYDTAYFWVFEEEWTNRAFSFNWVCEHLGIDASSVRDRLWRCCSTVGFDIGRASSAHDSTVDKYLEHDFYPTPTNMEVYHDSYFTLTIF